jgi:hypothetical protein
MGTSGGPFVPVTTMARAAPQITAPEQGVQKNQTGKGPKAMPINDGVPTARLRP